MNKRGHFPFIPRLYYTLPRVEERPARDVETLTPRLWKERFAGDPVRSDIDRDAKNADS